MELPGILKWYGGKGSLRSRLLPLIPRGGKPYCEPFCGAASIFFAREPAEVEVLNDLNEDLINLFRCFQDPRTFRALEHRLKYTLYSRAEFCRALAILDSDEKDPVVRAWAYFVAVNQSVSGLAETPGNWSRSFTLSPSGGDVVCSLWENRKSWFPHFHARLKKVQIDNRDALTVIRYWDNPEAVFYVDPPYHLETRKCRKAYKFESTETLHSELVAILLECEGAVVLSGYDHPVYLPLEDHGWQKIKISTSCHAAVRVRDSSLIGQGAAKKMVPRTEVVWRNPQAVDLTRSQTLPMGFFRDL